MTIDTATITISTTPPGGGSAPLGQRAVGLSPVGVVARVIAGITGAVFGLTIGLVSAGFETTRLLLLVGAAALALGWFFSVVTDRPHAAARRR